MAETLAANKKERCVGKGCKNKKRYLKHGGLCGIHYERYRTTGSIELRTRYEKPKCAIPQCDRKAQTHELLFCQVHYRSLEAHGLLRHVGFQAKYTYKGKKYNMAGLAKLAGISREAVRLRTMRGMTPKQIVETPRGSGGRKSQA